MMEEGKGIAMAILGIVAVIGTVGLVLLFTGSTGQVSYGSQFVEESAQRLCDDIACENGMGAVVLGEDNRPGGPYWVCGCPQYFADQRIADWSNAWKGDEARGGLDFPNMDHVFLIRKFREY